MQANNAVLVSLNITVWDANRQDRQVSDEVNAANGVSDANLGRFWKSLFPKNEALKQLFAAVRAARTFHYENTHAWTHDGPRLLPMTNYAAYMAEMRKLRRAFDVAVANFLDQYDSLKGEARLVLGRLYKDDDYPSVGHVKGRYGFGLAVQPVPATSALMELGFEPLEAEQLKRDLEANLLKTYESANRRLWEDLYSKLKSLNDKLGDEKAHIRESSVNAVKELADLLPRLNITNDQELNNLASKLKESFESVSAAGIRHNPEARVKAASSAQSIVSTMESFMKGNAVGAGLGGLLKRAA